MPIYEIWLQATRSQSAATAFMVLLFIGAIMALTAVQQTASRLTWSLGRDNAFLFSNFLGRVHPTLQVPIWALIFNNFVVFIIGFIFLGSSTAFNAFIGSGLVLQQVTYAFPAVLVMWRGRSSEFLPRNRPFRLWGGSGWVVNVATVVFAVVVLVFYDFPVVLPVTGSNMSESTFLPLIGRTQEGPLLMMGDRLYIGGHRGDADLCGGELVLTCTDEVSWAESACLEWMNIDYTEAQDCLLYTCINTISTTSNQLH